MKNKMDFLKNPLIWVLLLLALQVGVTFKLDSVTINTSNIQSVIEKMESEQSVDTGIINIVKAQQEVIESRDGVINALVSFQRTIGVLCVIILAIQIYLSFRRTRVN